MSRCYGCLKHDVPKPGEYCAECKPVIDRPNSAQPATLDESKERVFNTPFGPMRVTYD